MSFAFPEVSLGASRSSLCQHLSMMIAQASKRYHLAQNHHPSMNPGRHLTPIVRFHFYFNHFVKSLGLGGVNLFLENPGELK